MSSPFKTPKFKQLFKRWNKYLVLSGHEEIEDFSRDEPTLKDWHTTNWNNTDPIRNEWRQQYYEMAEVLLRTFPFKCEEHRRIWELHCEGKSPRKIAKILNQKKFSKTTIYSVISSIEAKGGLKNG